MSPRAYANAFLSGLNIATPFLNLPPRDLKDYYSVIKRPVSLKAVLKQVRGIKGREKPIGASFFKYWQSFEEEIRHIWNNARTFNEDESEITQYANELEVRLRVTMANACLTRGRCTSMACSPKQNGRSKDQHRRTSSYTLVRRIRNHPPKSSLASALKLRQLGQMGLPLIQTHSSGRTKWSGLALMALRQGDLTVPNRRRRLSQKQPRRARDRASTLRAVTRVTPKP